jgi:predicted NAD/FAD-binding protein
MVFNRVTYPYLVRLFDELRVPVKPTEMSFSVRHDGLGVEYNGMGLNRVFAQRRNLLRPRYLALLAQILRFFRAANAALDDPDVAGREIDLGPAGRHRVDRGIDQFVTGDVVVHAWDVATAAALDWPIERIVDEQVAAEMAPALTAIADMLVASGHYARAVPVADNANAQERLIAATGRDPHWKPAS